MGFDWLGGSYYPPLDLALTAVLAVVMAWALSRRLLAIERPGILLLVFGMAMFLIVPFTLYGAVFSDLRLIIGVLFLTLGFVRLEFDSTRQFRLFLAGFTGLFLLRTGSVAVAFMAMSPVIDEFRQSLAAIEPGSRVMVMTDDRHKEPRLLWSTSSAEDRIVAFALNHAPALAATERSSYVPIVFAQTGKQVLQVRPEYNDLRYHEDRTPLVRQFQMLPSSDACDTCPPIKDWQRSFDYLYVMFARPDDPVPFPNLELLVQGQHFRLYRLPH